MSDGTGSAAAAGTAPSAAQGASGTANPQPGGNATTPSTQGVDPSQFVSKADFDSAIKKLDAILADNAKYRQRLRSLVEDDESTSGGKESKDAKVSAAEARFNALMAEARRDRFSAQVTTAAVKAGAPHPELVVSALNIDDVADDKGNVKDVESRVSELKKRYPNLFASTSAGSANGGSGGGSGNRSDVRDVNASIRAFRRGG